MPDMDTIKTKYPYMFIKNTSCNNLYEKAWNKARIISAILKNKYAVKKVFVFGSLTDPELFDENSDIDIAVEGIDEELFYKAMGDIISKIGTFKVDLVDFNDCKKTIFDAIKREGIEI